MIRQRIDITAGLPPVKILLRINSEESDSSFKPNQNTKTQPNTKNMKSMLIDPVKQQIVPFQLSVKKGLSHAYEGIGYLNTMNQALALCRN